MLSRAFLVVIVLLAALALPASALAEGRLVILDASPVSVVLKQDAKGVATGELTLNVRAQGGAAGVPTPRFIEARGRGAAPKSSRKDVTLTALQPKLLKLSSGQVRRLPLRITVASAPTAALTGKLIVSVPGARAATIDVSAAVPAARWDKAYIEPAKVTLTDDSCKPKRIFGGGCGTPGDEVVTVKGLGPGKAYKKGQEVTSTAAAADSGNVAHAKLIATKAIAADAKQAQLSVKVYKVGGYGTYELTLPTDRAADKAPSLTVALKARDCLLYPLAVLVVALLIQFGLLWLDDRTRPKHVLKQEVQDARERYKTVKHSGEAQALQRPFKLGATFKKLLDEIDGAKSKEQLDDIGVRAAGLIAVADGWLATCQAATALHTAKEGLAGEEGAENMIAACAELLEDRDPPVDATALAAYQAELADQTSAVELWEKLNDLVDLADADYVALTSRSLDDHERHRLEEHDPEALRAAYLAGAASLADLSGVADKLRETIAVLKALDRANPAPVSSAFALGVASVSLPSIAVPESLGAALRSVITPSRLLLFEIKLMDWVVFLISAALVVLAAYPTLYLSNDDFGSTGDYFGVVGAVTAGTLAINWKRLPWWQSYKSTPAAKAEA